MKPKSKFPYALLIIVGLVIIFIVFGGLSASTLSASPQLAGINNQLVALQAQVDAANDEHEANQSIVSSLQQSIEDCKDTYNALKAIACHKEALVRLVAHRISKRVEYTGNLNGNTDHWYSGCVFNKSHYDDIAANVVNEIADYASWKIATDKLLADDASHIEIPSRPKLVPSNMYALNAYTSGKSSGSQWWAATQDGGTIRFWWMIPHNPTCGSDNHKWNVLSIPGYMDSNPGNCASSCYNCTFS
jgi:hypothetical protein